MPATIFSGNNVKALKSNLDLNGVTKILSVNADPASGAGVAAPLGSIAMDYLAGKVYKKTGSLDTEWQELGSGIGGINYIENSDAESGTAGWSTYADAAGSAPVDGTGGTANITWSRSTTSPLRGVADFNLVKDAVNRQGQGVSYDFTIDSADQAKILTISADYEVLSGTFATGDLAVYVIQDPAGTPVVLQPAGYQVTAGTNGNKLRLAATFQTASNVTSYRLCIHVASTSASAYTLAFDSIAVSPQQVVYGAPVTDWQAYTPTTQGFGTVTNMAASWRRVGDSIQLNIRFNAGTPTATVAKVGLPSGLSIDSTKLNGTLNKVVGSGATDYFSATYFGPTVLAVSTTTDGVLFGRAASTIGGVSIATGDNLVSSGSGFSFLAIVPILGWSSSVVVSSSTDTRVVAARYAASGSRTPTSVKAVNYDTKTLDTHSAVTTVSGDVAGWRFTAPIPGIYKVAAISYQAVAAAASVVLYKNGSFYCYLQTVNNATINSASTIIELVAGDYIDVRSDGTPTLTFLNQANTISIERLSGPSVIAASETVAARYESSAATSITTVSAAIPFATRSYDTHGAFSGSTFTAPISGRYRVSAFITTASVTLSTTQDLELQLYKNGSQYSDLADTVGSGGANNYRAHGTDTVQLNAGDTIQIYARAGTTVTMFNNAQYNHLSIERIGN